MTKQWRANVISYIKQKDRLLNPSQYQDGAEHNQPSCINQNLFDDDFDDNDHNTSDSSNSTPSPRISPVTTRRRRHNLTNESSNLSLGDMDSSVEASGISMNQPKQLTNAEARLKAIDDELERYANFSKIEFSVFCSERGFCLFLKLWLKN